MTTPHKKDKEALGKGIRSLLQSIDADLKTTSGELKSSVVEAVTNMLRIPLDHIETNPRQPRHDFDEQALQELAQSIRMHDIIQPVTVSRLPSGKYRLVSGERVSTLPATAVSFGWSSGMSSLSVRCAGPPALTSPSHPPVRRLTGLVAA